MHFNLIPLPPDKQIISQYVVRQYGLLDEIWGGKKESDSLLNLQHILLLNTFRYIQI